MSSDPGVSADVASARKSATQGQIAIAGIALLLIFAIGGAQKATGAVTSLYAAPLMLVAGVVSRRALAGLAALTALLVFSPLSRLVGGAASEPLDLPALLSGGVTVLAVGALLCWRDRERRDSARLRDDNARLRRFIDLAPAIFWTVDGAGQVRLFNDRLAALTGRRNADLIQMPDWLPLFNPADHAALSRFRAEPIAHDDEKTVQARLRRSDGGETWLLLIKRRMVDPVSGQTEWICGAVDIDAQIRATQEAARLNARLADLVDQRAALAERAEMRFQSLFDLFNIACTEQRIDEAKRLVDEAKRQGVSDFYDFLTHHEQRVEQCLDSIRCTAFSQAFVGMIGYASAAELQALPLESRLEGARQVRLLQLQAIFEERRQFTTTGVLIARDGRRIPVALGASIPADWSTAFFTHIDITEQVQAHEMALAAQDELARANRAATIGALSATIAHELNQPIVAVTIDAQTSLRYLDADPPKVAQAMETMGRVVKNAERVSAIVRHTREQLVRGSRPLERVDLCQISREMKALLDRELAARHTILSVKCPASAIQVLANRVELQQVFSNLIGNAVDAMAEQAGARTIDIVIGLVGEDEASVEIADSGPGVGEAEMNRIFDSFFSTKPDGIGIGLQISKAIVQSLGGRLSASNRPTGGAAFRFTLPLKSEASPETEAF
ncbi:ATP-binding protein [Methylocella sp.]|uniref:PAS domain-containing sensor histidine kinase n=1 Tax=Methylocella sp. TaxID=1978226 RepID=UPI003783EB0A